MTMWIKSATCDYTQGYTIQLIPHQINFDFTSISSIIMWVKEPCFNYLHTIQTQNR